jgi:aminoglycoside 6'-N-acetyltransferase
VRLRPATALDRPLVRGWLADGSIRAWWGPPSAVEAEIAIALDSDSAICRIIEADGSPVGYAHAFDCGLMETGTDAPHEPGVWQCAFLIGSEAHRGRGLGPAGLALLAAEVLATTLAIACEVRIPVRNEPAVRQIEVEGFRWHRVETDRSLGPVWIMRRERAARGI